MSSKVLEALEHIKAAEKLLRTSLLRWRPDFDSAADEYNQAAQCYRIAKELKKSHECHLKASENYKACRSFFHAAKSMENAIVVGRNVCTPDEISKLADQPQIYTLACEASSLYQQHGSGDSGASVLAKAARMMEEAHPEKAYKLFQLAAEASFSESSSHSALEYISKVSRLLVKLRMYDEAMESVRAEVGHHLGNDNFGAVGRLVVVAVLIQLARGDLVAAGKVYKEWATNCEQAEQITIETLLQGMDECDPELVRRGLNAPFIRAMDVEYARLAASIPIPEGDVAAVHAAGVVMGAQKPYVSGMASHDDPIDQIARYSHIQGRTYDDSNEGPYESVNLPGRSDGDLC